jgi:glc operon protein GlcG
MYLIRTKKVLTLKAAKMIAAIAAEKAFELKVGGAIAVVDDSGYLIYLERLEGTMSAAANIAIGKAATAAAFKRPTRLLEELIHTKRFAMLSLNDIPNTPYVPLMGGYPIVVDGEIVGAIAIAGAETGENDEAIALFAIKEFLKQ